MRRSLAMPAALLSAMLASCVHASLEDAAPRSVAEVSTPAAFAPGDPEEASAPAAESANDLPNLNIRPDTAAPQLSGEELRERASALHAARLRAGGGAAGVSDQGLSAEDLRRIAREREEETLRRIEGR